MNEPKEQPKLVEAINQYHKNQNSATLREQILSLVNKESLSVIYNERKPVELLFELGLLDLLKKIVKAYPETEYNLFNYGSALVSTTKHKNTPEAILLINAGAALQWRIIDTEMTPLHLAAENRNDELVKLLIEKGADLSKQNKKGRTPVQIASELGYMDIVETIFSMKPESGEAFNYGGALLNVIKENDTKLASRLIKADVSSIWEYKSTKYGCAHHAVLNKNTQILQLLIDKKADFARKSINNITAIELAADTNFLEGVTMIASHVTTDSADERHYAQALLKVIQVPGAASVIKTLIKAGALLPFFAMKQDESLKKESPFALATRLGHWDYAQILLDEDINNSKNKDLIEYLQYEQALYNTLDGGNFAIAKLLLQLQAPCNQWNSESGNIALSKAIHLKRADLCQLLITFKADPLIENMHGKTSVDLANKSGLTDIVAILAPAKFKYTKPRQNMVDIAREKYQAIQDNAVQKEIMPLYVDELFGDYLKVLKEDLSNLCEKRAKNQDVTIAESLNVLIRDTNTLLAAPETLISPEKVLSLAEKGFSEAVHMLDCLNFRSEAKSYAKRLQAAFMSVQKEYMTRKSVGWTLGFFEVKNTDIPASLYDIKNLLERLENNKSCGDILTISSAIIVKIAVVPEKTSQNQRYLHLYGKLSDAVKAVSFSDPENKVKLYTVKTPEPKPAAVQLAEAPTSVQSVEPAEVKSIPVQTVAPPEPKPIPAELVAPQPQASFANQLEKIFPIAGQDTLAHTFFEIKPQNNPANHNPRSLYSSNP